MVALASNYAPVGTDRAELIYDPTMGRRSEARHGDQCAVWLYRPTLRFIAAAFALPPYRRTTSCRYKRATP